MKTYYLVFLLFFFGANNAYARDDWQFWLNSSVNLTEEQNYKLNFANNLRLQNDFEDLYFHLYRINNHFFLDKEFQLNFDYSFVRIKNTSNAWFSEHRPNIDLIYKPDFLDFQTTLRLRAELRTLLKDQQEEFGRYRIMLKHSFSLFDRKAFVSEELFYDHGRSLWRQNRFIVGISIGKLFNKAASLSWGIQSFREGSNWQDRQIVIFTMKL